MKKILIFLSVFIFSYTHAQTYIKGNVLTTLLTIPNVGVETSIGEKSTFQFIMEINKK
jgi:nitrate/nitrite transporter NarK